MKTVYALSLSFCVFTPLSLLGDTLVNSWMKPTSGYWEEQTNWSLGVLPDATQSVMFTNAGWKALAIGPNTAQNFPQSMQIQSLQIASPTNSHNVFLMNFSGFQVPLQTGLLSIGSNSTVIVQSSMLEVNADTNGNPGNVTIYPGGTFYHGDDSQVTVQGLIEIATATGFHSSNAAGYFLTNGTLSVNSGLQMGGFDSLGEFVQYGGDTSVGGNISVDANNSGSVIVYLQSELDLYDGQLAATNGILVGYGDYANSSSFHQYGGAVGGDMVINGSYSLSGGSFTGRMTLVNYNQRVNGSVLQTGGTNFAISLSMGRPNEFGGQAFYTLSNGVVQVASDLPFRGGQFSQFDGQATIVSNLLMSGVDVGVGTVYANYLLAGGYFSAGGLTAAPGSTFQQNGGTSSIIGDLILSPAQPPQSGVNPLTEQYNLTGGFLSARNEIINAAFFNGGFHQTGGSNQISGQLTVQGVEPEALDYTLEGGTLAVKDIDIAAGAFFQHTGGSIIQSGVLTLDQGEWRAATNNQALGPLQLAGPNTNSAITFPDGTSILRLANSSAQPWVASAMLYITNWHGSASGGGATQLYFGTDSSGLTAQQLSQIHFNISGNLAPATLLATGEVVPATTSPPVQFSRNGGTLTVTWPSGWVLQSATNVTGPYNDVSAATSPWQVSMTNSQEFFRLRQ